MIRHLVLATVVFSVSSPTSAAELFTSPGGVWLRSIFSWERASGLKIIRDGAMTDAPTTPDGAQIRFSYDELCSDVGYATVRNTAGTANGDDVITLDHLCREGREDTLRFVFMADTQEDNGAHENTAGFLSRLIENVGPLDFIINAGDIVDRSTTDQWQAYRAISSQYTNQLPVVPVIGNHEYFEDPDLTFYNKVYGTNEHRGWYVLNTDAAALIVLNSSVDRMPEADVVAQDAWLKKTLAQLNTEAKANHGDLPSCRLL